MGETAKRTGRGCLGGMLGAILGLLIGGMAGSMLVTPTEKDSQLPITSGFANIVSNLFRMGTTLIGAGACGILGGIGGTLLAANTGRKKSTPTEAPQDQLEQ
jgi:ABC-type antimicrobial peptide transport system permease subunit